MASSVDICSNALIRLGAKGISSFLELSTGPICARLFPVVKKRVLSSYPWRFSLFKSEILNRTTTLPPTGYKFEYQLPNDMLTGLPRTVYDAVFTQGSGSPFTGFDIYGDKLLTSAEKILIDYQIDKQPEKFPQHVEMLTELAMAAALAFPVTDQRKTAETFFLQAWGTVNDLGNEGYSKEARRIDSQGNPAQNIKNFTLTAVRFGGHRSLR